MQEYGYGMTDRKKMIETKLGALRCALKMPHESDFDLRRFNCSNSFSHLLWKEELADNCSKDCPDPQKSTVHTTNSVSSVNGNCDQSSNQSRNCSSKIFISFQTSYKTVLKIRWERTIIELVSEIGGHLGLFVGVSIITLTEICEYFFRFWFDICSRIMLGETLIVPLE